MAEGNGSTMWLTRSYNMIDKDPECDRFRTMYQKERIKETDLAVLAGLSVSTVKNMFATGQNAATATRAMFAKDGLGDVLRICALAREGAQLRERDPGGA